jgi:uncharacterized membrane protein
LKIKADYLPKTNTEKNLIMDFKVPTLKASVPLEMEPTVLLSGHSFHPVPRLGHLKLLTVLLALFFVGLPLNAEPLEKSPTQPLYLRGTVLAVTEIESNNEWDSAVQKVKLKINSGIYKDAFVELFHQTQGGMAGTEIILKQGDKVILHADLNPSPAESPDGSPVFYVADYARDYIIYWLALAFIAALLLVGGRQGLRALLGLVITIALIFFVLFPLSLRGVNPLLAAILTAGIITPVVFLIIGGRTVKALSAALGTLLGVTLAGLIAFAVGKMIHLTGLSSEESRMLLYSLNVKIDYQGLLFGSILLGALGAVMDVGMSISSAIDEVRKVHPEANFLNLFNAGMNVGRDVIGTMSNTLILAYTAASLPLLLLLIAGDLPFLKALNLELIAAEVTRALAGSIGLILCVPLTAVIAALLHERKENLKR